MIHIFTIHSNITYLAALATIKHENIAQKDIILICNSNYSPVLPKGYKFRFIYNTTDFVTSFTDRLNKFLPFSYSKKTNAFIKEITCNNKYIVYLDLMSSFNKYLVFNKNCIRFNIIEEGIVNYGEFIDFNLLTADKKNNHWIWQNKNHLKEFFYGVLRLYRGRSFKMQSLPIHPNVYSQFSNVTSFCFSELAFPNTSSKNKTILNFNSLNTYELETNFYQEHTWFWIGDVLCKQYGIGLNVLKTAIVKLLEKINPEKKFHLIYLKFRGSEPEEEKNLTLKLLKEYGFTVKILNKSTILEIVFANNSNLNVCGIASSLLIYAFNAGHKTYSALPYLPDNYNISIYKSYPQIYSKVYENQ